jgi:hypothetical protein
MSTPRRISAKNLAELAQPEVCERCFWVQLQLDFKTPYAIFPGIFNSIDAYTKKMVHGWFDRHGTRPEWLNGLGDITSYLPPPQWQRFQYADPTTNITLTGAPDAVFQRTDNTYVIVDYKTAKFTDTQDELFPKYEAQLNAYAFIAEKTGLIKPVSALGLIYFEPITNDKAVNDDNCRAAGFAMDFRAHIQPVEVRPGLIEELLARARVLLDSPNVPANRDGCENCDLLSRMRALF